MSQILKKKKEMNCLFMCLFLDKPSLISCMQEQSLIIRKIVHNLYYNASVSIYEKYVCIPVAKASMKVNNQLFFRISKKASL